MTKTPENTKLVKEQIARLCGKPFPPTEAPVMAEVVNTLLASAESPEHAKRIVDELVRQPGPFPEPAVFSQVAEVTATMRVQPDPGHAPCNGVGYVSSVRVIDGIPYSAAMRCNCWAMRPIVRKPWEVEVSA